MSTTTPSSEKPVPPVVLPVDLRDYFAAKAMPVMLREMLECGIDPAHPANVLRLNEAAFACYVVADAMLKAREAQ